MTIAFFDELSYMITEFLHALRVTVRSSSTGTDCILVESCSGDDILWKHPLHVGVINAAIVWKVAKCKDLPIVGDALLANCVTVEIIFSRVSLLHCTQEDGTTDLRVSHIREDNLAPF